MTDRTGRANDDRGADSTAPPGDFHRGGTTAATATSRATTGVPARLGEAPRRLSGVAAAAGLVLAVPVAWSTWASPGIGPAAATIAGVAVLAATLLAFHLGWAVGGATGP